MELIYQVLASLAAACAVYGGIKADLKNTRESVERAHERLDAHIENHGRA
jgi:hypothetical protein